jgi:exonuclease SbcC
MIPRRIQLRNFISYRDCSIDFTRLHLAVLSGRNGDGKSALLDALTWALWGKARGSTVDDAIFSGADEMMVELEFEVDGDVFAVLRKRSRAKGSSVSLFQVDSEGRRTTRTGSTSRDTETDLTRLLRMDYDTFCNSAFLAQGRSDEFSRKRPGERKEVFRKVLGLERYQEYSEASKKRASTSQGELTQIRKSNDESASQVQQLPTVLTQLERATQERGALEASVAMLAIDAGQLQQAAGQFEGLVREAKASSERAGEAHSALEAARTRVKSFEQKLAAAEATIANGDRIESDYGRLQLLQREAERWTERLRESSTARQEMTEAAAAIETEKARLTSDLEHISTQVQVGQQQIARIPEIRAALTRLTDESGRLAASQAAALKLEKDAADAGRLAAEAGSQAEHARIEAKELKEKGESLEHTPTCPVCLRPMAPDDVAHVRNEYTEERRRLGVTYHEAKERERGAESAALGALEEAAALRKAGASRERALASELADAQAKSSVASDAEAAAGPLLARGGELQTLLENCTFAAPARARLAAATERLAAANYDEGAHAAATQEIKALAGTDKRYMELGQVRSQIESILATLVHERDAVLVREIQSEEALRAAVTARGAIEEAEDVGPRLAAVSGELVDARFTLAEVTMLAGGLESERTRLIALSKRLAAQRDTEKTLAEEVDVFGALTEGFGPSGVQAMLIDQSLPILEGHANDMLDRMTGGRIHIQFATAKPLKDGRSGDTLDIRISDELGTKDYEMYSGGERFRVDFAIRIGLARLLAQRAGASLPMLIIDEGFGSQDAEGIDRLLEVLNVIRDDFRLILVVTHLEEMKERFPQRIEVTKDPVRGSLVTVR